MMANDYSTDIRRRVKEFIDSNNMLENGDSVVIGVSGGADSMCLLFLLYGFREEMDLKLSVIHIEHGIRGKESKADADFVKQECEKLQIPVKIIETDAPALAKENGQSVEEAGREVRYDAFSKAGTDRIAVAHHENDEAETLLFNLFRGSGIRGIGGISPVNGKIIRPLLVLSRDEIERFNKENGIAYHTDSTNSDNSYSRNSIRNEIIPKALKINDKALEHMCQTAESMREADDFISKSSEVYYEKYVSAGNDGRSLCMDMSIFEEAHTVIAQTCIRRMIGVLAGRLKDIARTHAEEVISLKDKPSGRQVSLPYELTARREFNKIRIFIDDAADVHEIAVEPGRQIILADGQTVTVTLSDKKMGEIPNLPYTKWFDYDKIKNAVVFRTRRTGDMIDIKNARKKLKDVMINDKIPVYERDRLLLLADGCDIIWLTGYRISETYKVTEKTEKILMVKME